MSFPSADAQAEIATPAGRENCNAGTDETHTVAKAGFALVASREEGKVVVLDLQPLVADPSVVVTGFPIGDRSFTDAEFANKAYVGTADGQLFAYNVGGLATDAAATALQLSSQ